MGESRCKTRKQLPAAQERSTSPASRWLPCSCAKPPCRSARHRVGRSAVPARDRPQGQSRHGTAAVQELTPIRFRLLAMGEQLSRPALPPSALALLQSSEPRLYRLRRSRRLSLRLYARPACPGCRLGGGHGVETMLRAYANVNAGYEDPRADRCLPREVIAPTAASAR